MARVSLIEKNFTRPSAPLFAECRKPRNLRVIQPGEHRFSLFCSFSHGYSETTSST